jgi:hypothetical protein
MTEKRNQGSLSPSETRESIRDELESTRRAFHRLLDLLSDQDLQVQSLNPAWTVREVLYHMSLAPRNVPNDLVLIRRLNRIPKIPPGPFNWLNMRLTKYGARHATKKYLAEQYDRAHVKTLRALESIQDDEWQRVVDYPDWDPMLSGYVTIERLFRYITLHFESHAQDIRLALEHRNVHS